MPLTKEEKAAKAAAKEAAKAAKAAAKEAAKAAKAAEAAGTDAVRVFDRKNNFVRQYSATEHGPDFVKLAEGFAGKIGGTVGK